MFINWLSALICRSSHRRCSIKKDVKNFAKFTGKHLCRGLFLVSCRTQAEEILAQVFSCEFCKISKNTFCYRTPSMAASVCCGRKVAAVKIEKLKAFIIKYYDISKTYSVQFRLLYSANVSYCYFLSMVFSHQFSH